MSTEFRRAFIENIESTHLLSFLLTADLVPLEARESVAPMPLGARSLAAIQL